jgi:hypothetical protein
MLKALPARFAIATVTTATATTAAATVATVAATATTATESTTTTTAASVTALFSWTSFVNGEVPTVEFLTVELGDSGITFFFRGHLNETKTARTAGVAIFDDRG